jgi:AcrR family transcriptional regulator
MMDTDLKNKIKKIAVEHFNRAGYHGATIRTIAKEADCSLPMIYYYYKSKKDLFHEIIKKDYFNILKKQVRQIKATNILDFYTQFIYQINHLSDYDKKVYRLGIKVNLSFDGDEELMELMDKWEKTILPRHYNLVTPHLKAGQNGTVIVRVLIRLMENLIESIVVKSTYLSEEEIREELSVILYDI